MPCGSCGGGNRAPQVAYEAKFLDGTRQVFTTSDEARAAIRAKGGGTMRAVKATP